MSLSRTIQLGLLAKDLAAVRLRDHGPRRDQARRRLVARLGLMHGLPQKIGQLLAFSEVEGADPVFTPLTENEPALTAAEAREVVERHLGGPLAEFFATFEPQGIAASIGQVHRATLHDGRTVAVKFQLPGIAGAVAHDLGALGWLTAPIGDLRQGFDLAAYRAEIGESLLGELDYRREAASLSRFAGLTRSLGHPVLVPEVVSELSGEQLLVTTWLHGEHLGAVRHWPEPARATLSASLIELFFRGIFEWGLIHADPHPGNYRFLHCLGRPTVGLLDFGCVKRVPPPVQAGMRGLLEAGRNGRAEAGTIREQFVHLGFNPAVLARLEVKLPAVGSALTAPFHAPGKFDVASWHLRERLAAALGEDRLAFRTAGPPAMIFILRALQGLVQYLTILDAPVDWREAAGLDLNSPLALPTPPAPQAPLPARNPHRTAETLRLLVEENGATKVSLTFGADAVDRLPDLVPHELRDRLAERAVNLTAVADAARRGDYAPGELFSLVDGPKTVRVWLE